MSISYDIAANSLSEINLLVDENLSEPIRKIVNEYVKNSYVSVSVQLGDYQELLNLNTKDTNIIITTNNDIVSFLQEKELIEDNIFDIATDHLVLVSNSSFQCDEFVQCVKNFSKYASIVIANPKNILSGHIAKNLLLSLDIANFTCVGDEEKAVYVIDQGKTLGLLLNSRKQYLKTISSVPSALYQPIKYQVIAIKNRSSDNTRSFLKFLLLNKVILKDYGMMING